MSFCTAFSDEIIKIASGKTYPISRLLTMGIPRTVGAKGLVTRLAEGTITGNDKKAIRRILIAHKRVDPQKADRLVSKIVHKSTTGQFKGKRYKVSEFLSSRLKPTAASGAIGATTAALGLPTLALGAPVPLVGAAQSILTTASSQQISRMLGPRGLAGRITKGTKLKPAEKQLLKMVSPTMLQRAGIAGEKLKGKTKLLAKKLKKKMRKK